MGRGDGRTKPTVRANRHTESMSPGRLEYVQPYGVRPLANTENRPGTQAEITRARERAAEALERGRRRAEEIKRSQGR